MEGENRFEMATQGCHTGMENTGAARTKNNPGIPQGTLVTLGPGGLKVPQGP